MSFVPSNISEQILARIAQGAGELGYRPPTFNDLIRAVDFPKPILEHELQTAIQHGLIDTQQGDSGLTYIRRIVYAVESAPSPHAPAKKAESVQSGLAFFPSKNRNLKPVWHDPQAKPSQRTTVRECTSKLPTKTELKAKASAERAAKMAAERAAKAEVMREIKARAEHGARAVTLINRALIEKHLTQPLSAVQFAEAAGMNCKLAEAMLTRAQSKGVINGDNSLRPKLFFFGELSPEIQEASRLAAYKTKRALAIKKSGRDIAQLCAEYERGDLVADMCKRWKCHAVRLRELVTFGGGRLRSQREVNQRSGRLRAKAPSARKPRSKRAAFAVRATL